MTTIAAILLTAWLWRPAAPDLPDRLLEAQEWRESRHSMTAESWCCRGVAQVSRQYAAVPAWALWIPAVNRWEQRRMLRRFRRGCRIKGHPRPLDCALRAYLAGYRAARDPDVGREYADAIYQRREAIIGRPYAVAVLRTR